MAKRKKKVAEEVPVVEDAPVESIVSGDATDEEVIVEELAPLEEDAVDVAPEGVVEVEPEPEPEEREAGFKNTSGGLFDVFGIYWEVDECKDVPAAIQKEKKFKHALTLKCLTEM